MGEQEANSIIGVHDHNEIRNQMKQNQNELLEKDKGRSNCRSPLSARRVLDRTTARDRTAAIYPRQSIDTPIWPRPKPRRFGGENERAA